MSLGHVVNFYSSIVKKKHFVNLIACVAGGVRNKPRGEWGKGPVIEIPLAGKLFFLIVRAPVYGKFGLAESWQRTNQMFRDLSVLAFLPRGNFDLLV